MGFVGKEHSTCPSYRERENLCVLFYLLVREIEREREETKRSGDCNKRLWGGAEALSNSK